MITTLDQTVRIQEVEGVCLGKVGPFNTLFGGHLIHK